ncbi:hypothetical protein B566_EDAN014583 [Ephemera danica]|nr:hypothetical protein B566_EDAN014583 [Ephemera danica]
MHAAMKLGCVLFVICSQAIVVTLSCAEQLKEVMAEKKFGVCTSQNNDEIQKLIKEAYCKPRPTLVRIFSMDYNYLVYPRFVTVNRCSGDCPNKACLPTQEKIVSKTKYDEKKCMCKCANMAMMDACTRKPDWIWNQTNCRCECAKEEKCSTPYEWIPGRCACGMVMREESSENNRIGDDEQN